MAIFDAVRLWAYPNAWRYDDMDKLFENCLRRCGEVNLFYDPLPWPELKHIAKSIARFVWRFRMPANQRARFAETQTHRGQLPGQARRCGTPLEHDPAPCEKEGISRATWYRRRDQHDAG